MKHLVLAVATAAAVTVSGHTHAGTATATIAVSATVLSSCLVASTPLVFGNYNGTAATDATGSATITLICSGTSTATIEMDYGLNPVGTARRMTSLTSTDKLAYGLFQPVTAAANAACGALAVPFGTGLGASMPVIGLTLTAQVFNVCGNIPLGQSAALGAYSDLVTVNVTF